MRRFGRRDVLQLVELLFGASRVDLDNIVQHDLLGHDELLPTNMLTAYLCEKTIGKHYPIHSTRHSYVILMMELGVDMEFIREQLGHGGLQITREVYMHMSRKIQTKNLAQINDYLGKATSD